MRWWSMPGRAGAWLAPAPASSVILGSNAASFSRRVLRLTRNPLRRRGYLCLSPHLPGLLGPAGLGTSRRAARRRLPRFLRASSLHRSRCELALGLDAKTHHGPASRQISLYICVLL